MDKRALITGMAGFVGRHLAAYLSARGVECFGVGHLPTQLPGDVLDHWYGCDLRDADQVLSAMREIEPDYVFHLAALIKSNSLADSLAVNAIGTQNVLEAVLSSRPVARVLITGSAAEYGLAFPAEQPIREDNPLRPMTPYGLSKVAQSLLGSQYAHNKGLTIVRTRTFNLTGPGEPASLVCSAFAKKIAALELKKTPGTIRIGELESRRDLTDVRDAVAAYWLVSQSGQAGDVYNVCSGTSTRIGEILEILLDLAKVPVKVEVISRSRKGADVPAQQGSRDKLESLTQWKPQIPLRQSLEDLLDAWRDELS